MKRVLNVLCLGLLLVVLVSSTANAVTGVNWVPRLARSQAVYIPDSGPFVDQADIYRHLLEEDDMLVHGRYRIPYDSVPTKLVSETFLARLKSGSTELGSVALFPYFNNGYGYGSFSLYWDADSAPTWGGAYTIEVVGHPTLDWLDTDATSSLEGAIADDGGSQTNETSEANSAAADDITLLPATPVVGDAYYFGDDDVYSILTTNIGQQGSGNWTIAWEYYDGDSWEAIATYTDGTDGFTAAVGNQDFEFTPHTNWTISTVSSIDAYWIRARVSEYASVTTQPLGTQCWTNSASSLPRATSTIIEWRATTTQEATRVLLYSHLISWAAQLGSHWNASLIVSSGSGLKLSSYGDEYFSNVIPRLRDMCSNLFASTTAVPAYEDIDWQKSQSEAIKGSWPLDWSGLSTFFALPSDDEVFRTIGAFMIAFVLFALMIKFTGRADFAITASYGLLVVLAVPGFISPIILAGFTFTAVLLTGMVFILGKA